MSEVSEQANECANERANEQVAQYSNLYSWLMVILANSASAERDERCESYPVTLADELR